MRWIDLHPSQSEPAGTSSAEGTGAAEAEVVEAEIVEAARRSHGEALLGAQQAHRAASRSFSGAAQHSFSSRLREHVAAQHNLRAAVLGRHDDPGLEPHPGWPAQQLGQAQQAAEELPQPEAGISRPPLNVTVGVMAGPVLDAGFHELADLRRITVQNWEVELPTLDLLIIGSEAIDSDEVTPFLTEVLIPAARARELHCAMVVTSAPPIEVYLPVARLSQDIFATDPDAAEMLRSQCPEANLIEVIPHPVSPLLHTPLGTRPAKTELVGLLGMDQSRPAAQLQDPQFITPLFDGVLAAGRPAVFLSPEHRQAPAAAADAQQWSVPVDYAPWTPSTAAADLLRPSANIAALQRSMDVGLAVNAVMDSQAVFDPQVLQLQASGTLVLSTYNQGVNSYYPQVQIANSAEDVAKTLEGMSLEELRRAQGEGIRKVFTDHHGADVLSRICRSAGLQTPGRSDRVLAVADELTGDLEADLLAQTHPQLEITTWAGLQDLLRPDRTTTPSGGPPFDILLPVSSTHRYSPHYAADHAAAFSYQAARVTTKLDGDAASTDASAHQRRADVVDLSLSAWWRPAAAALSSPDALVQSLKTDAAGCGVYAIDHLGHRRAGLRRTLDPERGSDKAAAREEFRRTAAELGLQLAVVVPIYNNGDHLRHKAFASLRRSSIFETMHILLINDGSTDASTVDTIEELAHTWPNVSAFHHPRGGSGSASRPRNTGLELSFTEFVTYLDPDDEELDDGYWELLERLRAEPEADYALGTMAVWTRKYGVHDYHQWFLPGVEHRGGLDRPTRDSLARLNFRPASIEALVARREWLQSLGLVQPVGAVGQDSYFFQQMFFHTHAYVPVYRPVYTYYGAVETSIVNVVSPNYFRKYLILETDRAEWLRRVGLLETYQHQRFESFFVTWYLDKYKRVRPDQREEAATVLREIAAAYGDVRWKDPRALAFLNSSEGAS
ncbi:glycosyltransferase family 2 protein [Nesterenkonia halotolerans]|uniref:Glycosyltransferase involved in cell wall biosynthesis n=1 Tax=Nesterenkonia halotolerans TaxID=225325 RepID=A0ABR9J326_9MICC|nr:glycosyltransferase [Nesterenkonia halotolerans]MBE1513407.1 glycosyltransferase involved in cell wall biosynthesis [Nesterenkonia halotolerans]